MTRVELLPIFEQWAIDKGLAFRNHDGFWFYRNGGDGLFEAWLGGYCYALGMKGQLK